MTTGELPYTAAGQETKAFYVQDGGAIRLWQSAGGSVAIISGRDSKAVIARAKDLDIHLVIQGVPDKTPAYERVCQEVGVSDKEVGVVGDDLLDLALLRRCGYPIAVANAIPRVKRAARYVTRREGGQGAVTEVVERLLRSNGTWTDTMAPWQV